MSYVDEILERVKKQNPHEAEFNQAVTEVLESLRPVIEKNEEKYRRDALLERLTTPERVVLVELSLVGVLLLDPLQNFIYITHKQMSSLGR